MPKLSESARTKHTFKPYQYYIGRDRDFGLFFIFIIPIIPINNFFYINVILFVVLKKIMIYIIFIKLLLLWKKINIDFWICYNLKVTNICTYNFNQNQNFI